jgi:hypothetical protein
MGHVYQCWWRICREINVLSRFEYHMFYVLYPFVSCLLTLPRTILIFEWREQRKQRRMCHGSWCPDRDTNRTPPVYKSGPLPPHQPLSCPIFNFKGFSVSHPYYPPFVPPSHQTCPRFSLEKHAHCCYHLVLRRWLPTAAGSIPVRVKWNL